MWSASNDLDIITVHVWAWACVSQVTENNSLITFHPASLSARSALFQMWKPDLSSFKVTWVTSSDGHRSNETNRLQWPTRAHAHKTDGLTSLYSASPYWAHRDHCSFLRKSGAYLYSHWERWPSVSANDTLWTYALSVNRLIFTSRECAFVDFASGYASMWQPASKQYISPTTPISPAIWNCQTDKVCEHQHCTAVTSSCISSQTSLKRKIEIKKDKRRYCS